MPALTRRRSTDAREECWHIYYGDVRVGTIAVRSGNPHDTDPWQWSCGFYPGSHIRTEPPPPSTRPAPTSRKHGPYFCRNAPKPISSRGAINRHGLPRSTAASLAASVCRRTGGRSARHRCIMADWTRKFDEPIPVPKGRRLVTLRDAGDYIAKLPKAK